ncbi:MAG: class I SAM-dependent methyltransferase [Rhodospirillaceae bacterium]|nr:class I SAM-dependent methyltransferase [Rhodospirillales bacterium]
MTWDGLWEHTFSSRGWGRYPSEELVRFIARNYYAAPERDKVRFLELGCGPGPNLWYLAREGFTAEGMDGSPTALRQALERLEAEGLAAPIGLRQGDVLDIGNLYEAGSFDCVLDIACLQHNPLDEVERTLDAVLKLLKPGGRMLSTLMAAGSWGDRTGREVSPGTWTDIAEGPLAGGYVCHFFTEAELAQMFGRFASYSVERIDHAYGPSQTVKRWIVGAQA